MSIFRWQSAVDFVVLTTGIYLLLKWGREARALRMALGILALRVGGLMARQLGLPITGWVLDAGTLVLILALVIVFQPEMRRALMRLDLRGRVRPAMRVSAITALSAAAAALARARCGALLVIVQQDSIAELVTAGVILDGQVSADILVAVFQKESPVHDGAAVIDNDLLSRVGVVLPLTQRPQVPAHYGTRHRAGLGLSERSDALVVVVSEERGEMTLMHRGQSQLAAGESELAAALTALTTSDSKASQSNWTPRLADVRLQAVALALSATVWGLTFLFPGTSVRVRTVPLEFTHVPPGLTIASQSVETVEVWLRGSDLVYDSVSLDDLIVRCNLAAAHEGSNTIPVPEDTFELPLGLRVERVAPRQVSIRLASTAPPPVR